MLCPRDVIAWVLRSGQAGGVQLEPNVLQRQLRACNIYTNGHARTSQHVYTAKAANSLLFSVTIVHRMLSMGFVVAASKRRQFANKAWACFV